MCIIYECYIWVVYMGIIYGYRPQRRHGNRFGPPLPCIADNTDTLTLAPMLQCRHRKHKGADTDHDHGIDPPPSQNAKLSLLNHCRDPTAVAFSSPGVDSRPGSGPLFQPTIRRRCQEKSGFRLGLKRRSTRCG